MASGKSTTYQNAVVAGVASARVAFCTTNPTEDSAGTGLAGGGGYSPGGVLLNPGTPVGGVIQGPASGTLLFTNGSVSPWVITGLVIHTAGATHPSASQVVYWSDAFNVTVSPGGQVEIPTNGVTITEL